MTINYASCSKKLMALAGVLSIVATRLLELKLFARVNAAHAIEPGDIDDDVLAVLESKRRRPKKGWTAGTLLASIASLGGYLARKSDGPPGWLTLWRGWQKLNALLEGYRIAKRRTKCGER